MEILKKGKTSNNEDMQIEDWSSVYNFMAYGSTLAVYPYSKQTLEGQFLPKLNDRFRFQLNFQSGLEAEKAFTHLKNGTKQLKDYICNFSGNKELLKCI